MTSLFRTKAVGSFFLAALLSTAAWAANPVSPGIQNNNSMPIPGTLNYVEGKASVGNEVLTNKSIGQETLAPGQTLNTGNGKAEVLLTPGVFLRLGDNSSVKMISSNLADTTVELDRGRALVEVDDLHKDNNLRVAEDGVQTQIVKDGLYDFDADQGQIRVDKGKAEVLSGDHKVKLDYRQMVDLRRSENGKLKREKFDPKKYEGDLYTFSKLRSQYLADASNQAAEYYGGYPSGWGPGWWWDPWFNGYTFFPYSGFMYSPFGWGFYSPMAWYGGWGGWYGGARVPWHGPNSRPYGYSGPGRPAPAMGARPAPAVGVGNVGFAHDGAVAHSGFSGGGFHGGGAFHGGGGFGGFHGR